MQVRNVRTVLLALGLVASVSAVDFVAAPTGSLADDSGDGLVKGKHAMFEAYKKLEGEIQDLDGRIEAEEKKDEPDESVLSALRKERDGKQSEANTYAHRLNAGGRKYEKVVRDEGKIADQDKIIQDTAAELKKGVESGTLSPDRIEDLQKKIQDAQAEKTRLQNRIGRKEKQYKRKIGEDMPDRCKDKTVWNEGAKACVPVCDEKTQKLNLEKKKCEPICTPPAVLTDGGKCEVPRKIATDAQKLQLDECYTPDEKPIPVKMAAYFSLGDSGVSQDSKVLGSDLIWKAFDENGKQVVQALTDGKYDKVYKFESTGYVSRVNGKTLVPSDLAMNRATGAMNALTAYLKTSSHPISEMKDFDPEVNATSKFEVGPKWSAGDYHRLARVKVTEKNKQSLLKKYAEAVLSSPDPTPAKVVVDGKGDLQATMKNLEECCAMSEATLKYQPYQYAEVQVYGAKYTPDTEACRTKSDQVANSTEKVFHEPTGEGTSDRAAGNGQTSKKTQEAPAQ